MKKSIYLLLITILSLTIFAGCSLNEAKHSPEEEELISLTNSLVEEKFEVKINEEDYMYGVGRQIKENQFVDYNSKEKADESSKNIVTISGQVDGKPNKGQAISFFMMYNTETKKVIDLRASVY